MHPDETFEAQRAQLAFHFERNQAGFGARNRICAENFIRQHRKAVGADRLQTQIERASLACGLDARFHKSEIFLEDGVLQCDRERKYAIEPALDRGKVIAQAAIGVLEL